MEDIVESRARRGTINFRAPLGIKRSYSFLGMNQEDGAVYIHYNQKRLYRCTVFLGQVQSEAIDYLELMSQSLQPGWKPIKDKAESPEEAAAKISMYLLVDDQPCLWDPDKEPSRRNPTGLWRRLWRKIKSIGA